MAAWNANDNYKQSNVAAATYSFKLRGGYYWFEFNGTGAGTVITGEAASVVDMAAITRLAM